MQQSHCLKTLILVLAFGAMLATVAGACGGCMRNNVACFNTTHYRPCVNNKPLEVGMLSCGPGKICTALLDPCWESIDGDGVEPDCSAEDVNCRSCDDNQLFVCTSRTTFQMCNGRELSPQINVCPGDTVCAIDSGEFCVKSCKLPNGKYECDKAAP